MTAQIIDFTEYKVKKEIDAFNSVVSQYIDSNYSFVTSDIYTTTRFESYNKWTAKEDDNEPD